MKCATLLPEHAAPRKRSLSVHSGSFALFNSLHTVACVSRPAAIHTDTHADQHTRLTWLAFPGVNQTMALRLHPQNGRWVVRALAVDTFAALLGGAMASLVAWVRWARPHPAFLTFL